MSEKTKSKTSPKTGTRGCLGDDGKYSKENCNGDLQNQGVGTTVSGSDFEVTNTNETRIVIS